ncbi:hypothetical protein SLS53_001469 [Cytospora paraplurivora]|uniref:Uncharacterized protein n=1 Tax=Cytospora paraplurivora TaxID=2898453 RepID=A0AAN9YK89_9PEZI
MSRRIPKEGRENLQPPPARTREDARTWGAKRRRDQGDDLQPPTANARGQPNFKRRRTEINTFPAATDHKMKRGREEDYDQQPQTADAGGQPSAKKPRRDINTEQLPSSTASGSKGKRKRGPDQADKYELQTSQEGGQPGAKRRKAGKGTIPPRGQNTRGAPTASCAARARRQPPSEEDPQSFAASQPNERDAQRTVADAGENAPENTARRGSTRIRAGARAGARVGTRAGTRAGSSTKSGAIKG